MRGAVMPSGHGERYDFFLSRRGSVAAVAREVADVLTEIASLSKTTTSRSMGKRRGDEAQHDDLI
jgi:hypothetical protein